MKRIMTLTKLGTLHIATMFRLCGTRHTYLRCSATRCWSIKGLSKKLNQINLNKRELVVLIFAGEKTVIVRSRDLLTIYVNLSVISLHCGLS